MYTYSEIGGVVSDAACVVETYLRHVVTRLGSPDLTCALNVMHARPTRGIVSKHSLCETNLEVSGGSGMTTAWKQNNPLSFKISFCYAPMLGACCTGRHGQRRGG